MLGHAPVLQKDQRDIGGDIDGVRRFEIARVQFEENVPGAEVLLDEPFAVEGHLLGVWARPGFCVWKLPPPDVMSGEVVLGFGADLAVDGQEAKGRLFGIADKSH